MNTLDAFDSRIECWRKHASSDALGPETLTELLDAAIFVKDTLDLCVTAAETLFKDATTGEVIGAAFSFYDRVLARRDAKHKYLKEMDAWLEDSTTQPPME